jgi:hypothetical protein
MIKTVRKRGNKVEVTRVSKSAKAAFFFLSSSGRTTFRQRDGSSPGLKAALAAVNRKHGRLLKRLAG